MYAGKEKEMCYCGEMKICKPPLLVNATGGFLDKLRNFTCLDRSLYIVMRIYFVSFTAITIRESILIVDQIFICWYQLIMGRIFKEYSLHTIIEHISKE